MDDIEAVHGMQLYESYLEALARTVSGREDDMRALTEAGVAIYRLGYEDYFGGRGQLPMVFGTNRCVLSLWDCGHRAALTAARIMLCKCDCVRGWMDVNGRRICARQEQLGLNQERQRVCRLSCRGDSHGREA